MPRFVQNPPAFEAREFTGGDASALDIQGWMLANNIQSEHVAAVGNEGDEDYVGEHILFVGDLGFPDRMDAVLSVGSWAMLVPQTGGFIVLSASELYSQYTQTP